MRLRRVVELAPEVFRARTNLGLALLNRGLAEEALPHLQEAARLHPDMAVLHHNHGNALRALTRHEEARAAYLEATRLAGFQEEEARRFFGQPPKISSALAREFLTPWPAGTAEQRFRERFEKLRGLVRTPLAALARATIPNRPARDGKSRNSLPIPRKTRM